MADPNTGMWDPIQDVKTKYPKIGMSDEQIYKNLLQPDKFRSAFPQYAKMSDADIKKGMAKFNSKYGARTQAAKPQGPITAREALTSPGATLQRRADELGQTAQEELNKAFGPEAAGRGMINRAGHAALATVPQAARLLDQFGASIYGMANPKDAPIVASGMIDPAIPAAYYGTQMTSSLLGLGGQKSSIGEAIKHPTPANVEKPLTEGAMLASIGSSAGAPGMGSGPANLRQMGQEAARPVGEAARRYAEKVARQTTGLGPDKTTGIDHPARFAEATRKVVTLKNASEKYGAQTEQTGAAIQAKAEEAKNAGVSLNPTETAVVYSKMDKILSRSAKLRDMILFNQTKSGQWKGARPSYLDPVQAWLIKDDLDKIINYETVNNKRTPVGQAAHELRTEIDKTLDDRIPGWQDLNERYSSLRQATEKLEARHQQSFGKYVSGQVRDILTHPMSAGAAFLAGYEGAGAIPGMPHIGKWMTGVAASGAAHSLYNSLPSQTARIAFADSLADRLIGPRAPKGPSSYPGTVPPGMRLPPPPGPPVQGGTINPQGGGPGGAGGAPPRDLQAHIDALAEQAYADAMRKSGASAKQIEEGIAKAKSGTGSIEPSRELVTDPKTGAKKVKIGIDKDRAIKMSITGLYKDRSPQKMLVEMLQNAYDEVRSSGGQKQITYVSGEAKMPHDPGAGDHPFMTLQDSGRGMTPDQLGTVFTNLYESGKETEAEASGGWGVAKTSFQLGGKYFRAESVVQGADGKLHKYVMQGTPEEMLSGVEIKEEPAVNIDRYTGRPQPAKTGMTMTVWLPKDTALYEANNYFSNAAKHAGDQDILFNRNTYSSDPWSFQSAAPIESSKLEHVTSLDTPGANVNLSMAPIEDKEVYGVDVYVMNKGLLQFTHNVNFGEPVKGVPEYLVADVSSKVRPGHEKYPWTQSRESMHSDIEKQVNDFVLHNLFDRVKKQRFKELTDAWNAIQPVQFTGPKGTKSLHFYDETGDMTPTINAMATSPYWGNYMDVVHDINKYLDGKFIKGENKVSKFGIFFPKDQSSGYSKGVTLGINIPNPGRAEFKPEDPHYSKLQNEAIFLNPFGVAIRNDMFKDSKPPITTAEGMASHQFNTLIHEYAHNLERSHGVQFEGRMAEIEALIPLKDKLILIQKLTDALAGEKNAGEFSVAHPDFTKELQRYVEARQKETGKRGPLSQTGVSDFRPAKR